MEDLLLTILTIAGVAAGIVVWVKIIEKYDKYLIKKTGNDYYFHKRKYASYMGLLILFLTTLLFLSCLWLKQYHFFVGGFIMAGLFTAGYCFSRNYWER